MGETPKPSRQPQRYQIVGCTANCSFNERNLTREQALLIHSWFEAGMVVKQVLEQAKTLGVKLTQGAGYRHYNNHLHPIEAREKAPKRTDLEVIEEVIQRGAQQVTEAHSKVTAEQLLRAIELKLKLTQGSVFDAMYEAMRKGEAVESLDAEFEADEAQRAEDEGEQAGTDDREA